MLALQAVSSGSEVVMASTQEEQRAVIREMIDQENDLRNQRLGYLLTLNGFLFAALAFGWDRARSDPLVLLIGILGTAIGVSGIASMRISNLAIERLRDWSDRFTGPPAVQQVGDWEPADPMPPVVGMRGDLPN